METRGTQVLAQDPHSLTSISFTPGLGWHTRTFLELSEPKMRMVGSAGRDDVEDALCSLWM